MDRIRWDSDAYDDYAAVLNKAFRNLENEIQQLTDARKHILLFNADGTDQALNKIVHQLERQISRLEEPKEKARRLWKAVEGANELFGRAEKRIEALGTDLLYSAVAGSRKIGQRSSFVSPIHTRFQSGDIHPQWLYDLAEKSSGSDFK